MTGVEEETPQDEISSSTDAADAGYRVTPELVREITDAIRDEHPQTARQLVAPLHAADLADVLETLAPEDREALVGALGETLEPEVLAEVDEQVRDELIEEIDPRVLAAAATELETDDAAYLLEDLQPEDQQKVLDAMPAEDRRLVEAALGYPEHSAGRLMQTDYVAVPEYWTVGQVIDWLREGDDVPDNFYEIFVVDSDHMPIGTIPLNRAMRTKRPVPVTEIMEPEQKLIPVTLDQEEVAFIFDQYALTSAAVVDDKGRLLGQVTIDDVVDVIQEEAEEDLNRLAGVAADGDFHLKAFSTARRRFVWLLVNLGTAILASATIALFADTIEQIVALAVLMPIVASMGGNAGTQTLTVAVRALATKELTTANAFRILVKEVIVGGYNGIAFAILIGLVAGLWYEDADLGIVIAAAMVINMIVAGASGIMIPLLLWRAGVDPAVSAAVLLTTITDVIGFFAFLGLAKTLML